MDRQFSEFIDNVQSDQIVGQLQTELHLRPHQSIAEAIGRARAATGFCPGAADEAMHALRLDGTRKIGRLRRCELVQLARVIYRYWRQPAHAPAA